eukprot:CAMPEP_0183364348 /NCGR_PEP_ID=MMETSP0164_2-20130417/79646_1 /TAXON_ID=221442 /ORGANISM="Coccolithus pelagicus ssp braarudi, Strain PLY182g" /LENGTH=206 /DNA_ID=CAMNT_0025539621 /DNA_START=172 /DNA_END=793 /DNA_ORIENTATION=+
MWALSCAVVLPSSGGPSVYVAMLSDGAIPDPATVLLIHGLVYLEALTRAWFELPAPVSFPLFPLTLKRRKAQQDVKCIVEIAISQYHALGLLLLALSKECAHELPHDPGRQLDSKFACLFECGLCERKKGPTSACARPDCSTMNADVVLLGERKQLPGLPKIFSMDSGAHKRRKYGRCKLRLCLLQEMECTRQLTASLARTQNSSN